MAADTISRIVSRYMAARNLTREKLAEIAGLRVNALHCVLYPAAIYPTTLDAVCKALGLTLDLYPYPGSEDPMVMSWATSLPFASEMDRVLAVDLAERALRYVRRNTGPAMEGGGMLSDRDIKTALAARRIIVEPYDPKLLQPAGLDVRAGEHWIPRNATLGNRPMSPVHRFEPDTVVIGSTAESLTLAHDLCAQIHGRTGWERHGLFVMPGWIDPGYTGVVGLTIRNLSANPIFVPRGDAIAQIRFFQTVNPSAVPYGMSKNHHYQGQVRATKPMYGESGKAVATRKARPLGDPVRRVRRD